MPSATQDTLMDESGEREAIQSFLDNAQGFYGGDFEIDQADKAQDAINYEDISDEDDLPEEEEATQRLDEDDDNDSKGLVQQLADGLSNLPGHQTARPQTNGHHHGQEGREGSEGDLFGDFDDALFGEHASSPELQRAQPAIQVSASAQSTGLALPNQQSGLALPGATTPSAGFGDRQRRMRDASTPMSLSFESDGDSPTASGLDDGSDSESDPEVRMQRNLIGMSQRRVAGEQVETGWGAFDPDVFYNIFPRYEENQNPNFIDLFPQRGVAYRGKVPFKPPKALYPTKLSLDVLQDQEKAFKSLAGAKMGSSTAAPGLIYCTQDVSVHDSDDDITTGLLEDDGPIGGITADDLALICEEWDILGDGSDLESRALAESGNWESAERARPRKRQRVDILDADFLRSLRDARLRFEEPERATAKLSRTVTLDMNDPNLLIDETEPLAQRSANYNDQRRSATTTRDLAKRYNISNDQAYDLLKENHQHKIRSTLGSMTVEHSLPAIKLQFPFYKVALDSSTKRSFHRPHLEVRDGRNRDYRFQKLKHIKRKAVRGREAKELFNRAEDLHLGDNANVLMLEYSEEAPMVLSNFGMGSRLINYYRKRSADDQDRPKREIGETQVLLTQDKSPFANFGHVDQGEMVPTIQNGLFRAPIFEHKADKTDFLVNVSTTYANGNRFYIRNVENLHTVGQQLPLAEVPTEHSRKVTDASKKRLRAISYRIHTKAVDPMRPGKVKPLNNENIMKHLPGHDMPQTRSKMREFMKYERAPGKDSGGIWVPQPGFIVPDAETLRSWIKPEDVCLLESMQVGVQHLTDLGLYSNSKEGEEEKDVDDSANIEIKLAPWNATKNFLNACQGKAMLKLHGEGDPTGRGEGFDFVKTSMKGGFQALGESAQDKVDAKKRKETGGHSYNVAKQQKAYDKSIRWIWDKQKQSLSTSMEVSDTEIDDEGDADQTDAYGRAATPRSTYGTPGAFSRQDDESASQFSRGSVDRGDKVLIISRTTRNAFGEMVTTHERVTNQRVIKAYRKKTMERKLQELNALDLNPTGDPEEDEYRRQQIQKEINRISRNAERRMAREKAKGKPGAASTGAASPAAAASTKGEDGDESAPNGNTPQKPGRGRNKDGTARKCANCGQVGHIKTNRKSVPRFFECIICGTRNYESSSSATAVSSASLSSPSPIKSARRGKAAGITDTGFAETSAASYLCDDYSLFQL